MNINDLVEKYTPIGRKYGEIKEHSDQYFFQKTIHIENIRFVYSTYFDGEELDIQFNDHYEETLPNEIREELNKDVAKYLLLQQ